jgi:hypothetical protein
VHALVVIFEWWLGLVVVLPCTLVVLTRIFLGPAPSSSSSGGSPRSRSSYGWHDHPTLSMTVVDDRTGKYTHRPN